MAKAISGSGQPYAFGKKDYTWNAVIAQAFFLLTLTANTSIGIMLDGELFSF